MIMTEVIHIFLRRNNTKMDGKSLKKYLDWSDLWSLAGGKVYRLIPRDIGHRTLSQYSVQRALGKNFTLYQYILKVFYLKIHPLERETETLISNLSLVEWASPRHFSIPNLGLDPKWYIQKVDQNLLGTISMALFGLAGWFFLILFWGRGNPWSKEWGWR